MIDDWQVAGLRATGNHVNVVGYFLDKLKSTQEGGSNLLDTRS